MTKHWLIIATVLFININCLSASGISESDLLFKEATDAVKEKNYLKAIDIFEQLANESEADAQYNLALLLRSGKGKPQDYKASLKWAWLSLLGDIQEANKLVDELKDIVPEAALREIRKDVKEYVNSRADAGDMKAISQMGDYFLIVAEEMDYKGAYLWFLIASAFQIDGGISKRDKAEREIEGKDILKIQGNALAIFEKISENIK